MKPITLRDVLPEKPEFEVTNVETGKVKSYRVRPPTLQDRVWIRDTFGTDEIFQLITAQDILLACKLAYRLLSDADRRDFPARDAKIMNDEGEEKHVRLTGPEHLLASITAGDFVKISGAIMRAIILSEPMAETAITDELKKKILEANQHLSLKKSPSPRPTGRKSLTRSRTNMDGQKRKSRR